MKLLILNGPNLNLLGRRETDVYGTETLDELRGRVEEGFPGTSFRFHQANDEGSLVDALHAAARDGFDGCVFNPAGFSHTSVALRDAIAATQLRVVEVHISNVHAREEFRHTTLTGAVSAGVITGLGFDGYALAVRFLLGDAF